MTTLRFPMLPIGKWVPVPTTKMTGRWFPKETTEWLAVRAVLDPATSTVCIETRSVDGPGLEMGEPYFADTPVSVWGERELVQGEWVIRYAWETEGYTVGLQHHEMYYRIHLENGCFVVHPREWSVLESVYP